MQQLQAAIESLQAKGACPRLHVDATHEAIVLPDFVRDRWKERLVIDLDPSYPLELEFTKVGVEANLSFGGHVTRCVFPWLAIYVIGARGEASGRVFADHVPAPLRSQLAPGAVDPSLIKATDKDRDRGSRRRKRRKSAKQPALVELSAVEASPDAEAEPHSEADPQSEAEPEAETQADEQKVATRRAAFTVIDGGS